MISVLFVCHGNICRSPMAEFVFKDMINKKQLQSDFYIASAGILWDDKQLALMYHLVQENKEKENNSHAETEHRDYAGISA